MNFNVQTGTSLRKMLVQPAAAKWLCLATLVTLLIAMGCESKYEADVEPRENGEPGPDLKRVYSKEFRVGKADYFTALEAFYSFAQARHFTFVSSGHCFNEVLGVTGRPLDKPCIALWAATGTPTKAHMTFTIEEKSVNRTDRNDQLRYRVEIFIFEIVMFKDQKFFNELGMNFEAEAEPRLTALSMKVGAKTTQ